jgi:hypothetical protein
MSVPFGRDIVFKPEFTKHESATGANAKVKFLDHIRGLAVDLETNRKENRDDKRGTTPDDVQNGAAAEGDLVEPQLAAEVPDGIEADQAQRGVNDYTDHSNPTGHHVIDILEGDDEQDESRPSTPRDSSDEDEDDSSFGEAGQGTERPGRIHMSKRGIFTTVRFCINLTC